MGIHPLKICISFLFSFIQVVFSATDPADFALLKEFRDGLENPELLEWPTAGADDPCGQSWKHVFCDGSRITQIQVQNMSLKGTLPKDFNKLSMLDNLGLQRNQFTGPLPSFNGLSKLRYAFLDYNKFDSIPSDFFDGLDSLEVLALDSNDFNASTGWSFPKGLQGSSQLTNLSCMNCNLVGPLPDFLGSFVSLQNLRLSGNSLSGELPASFKDNTALQRLWLNNQKGGGLTGTIDVVAMMESATVVWLHGNQFTGAIPETIGNLTALRDLNLNGNKLVGLVPASLADLSLQNLDLSNNQLMGPIPKFKAAKVSFIPNAFCQSMAGVPCAAEVMSLIEFLAGLDYPSRLVSSWTGNDPCSSWLGVRCNPSGKVDSIVLPNYNLSGTLSPSVGKLASLSLIRLESNNITGPIPANWTSLPSLKTVDVSSNNITLPLPKFSTKVNFVTAGNPLLTTGGGTSLPVPGNNPSSPNPSGNGGSPESERNGPKRPILVAVLAPIVSVAVVVAMLAIPLSIYCYKKRKGTSQATNSLVIHPREPSDLDNSSVKIAVANNTAGTSSAREASRNSSGVGETHTIETRNLIISVQVLRDVTNNFAKENVLGRGGFGVVYKGELDDGTTIAVKRMESGVISSKAVDEFRSEIAVLSKVRHRHLVSLTGYSIEGSERILVYEYMPQGALSRHLFHWKKYQLEPLSWKRRLNIALDVARGMEYLHTLAHQSFIHRDLKSSNILLGDDFRAKVSDFGLVRLAPNGEKSMVTKLAGTFGYLAPEYAETGKITTKVDVYSFGVVLMEMLTGLVALDVERAEEKQHLASWFQKVQLQSDKEMLKDAIDPELELNNDDTLESISVMAELAWNCTARDPGQRPEMGYAVNMLAPLVEKWKPMEDDPEDYCGIDYSLPLNQMVKGWQEAEGKDLSYVDLEDSKGSIPARPTGFADSFTSADGR
ncbi:Receptor-like kinase TMK3 [Linum grandiflorum]